MATSRYFGLRSGYPSSEDPEEVTQTSREALTPAEKRYLWEVERILKLKNAEALAFLGLRKDDESELYIIAKAKETKDVATQTEPRSVNTKHVLLVLAIACLLFAVFIKKPEPEMKSDFDLVATFEEGVDKLQQSFTNQTERFWNILESRGLAHLRNKDPSQPLVFLLAAPPPAHEWVDCLATKLAEKLDPKHKENLATIDGNKEKRNSAGKTKIKMDELLEENFNAGHRVALIHHLELLPYPSPLLFYSYCDDQNAPYKNVAIIFTVHLPVEPSSSISLNEAEATVENYLANEVWPRNDKDAVAALLSRIADTVALMNGESGYLLKAFCS